MSILKHEALCVHSEETTTASVQFIFMIYFRGNFFKFCTTINQYVHI